MAEFKLAGAFVEIRADARPLTSSLTRLRTSLTSHFRAMSDSAKDVFRGTLGAQMFTGLVHGATNLGRSVIGASADMERLTISLRLLTGNAAKANQLIKELTDLAIRTPFEMPQLAQATNLLLAFGFKVESVIPLVTILGEAASASHLGMEEGMRRVTIAIGQMQGKQRVMTQEMNQLTEAGIPAWEFLAKAIGTDVKGAMALVEKSAVSAGVGITAILGGVIEKFGGAMRLQSKSFSGLMSTMRDSVRFLGIEIGEPLFTAAKRGLIRVIEFLGSPAAKEWAVAFRNTLTNIASVLSQFGRYVIGVFQAIGSSETVRNIVAGFLLVAPVLAGIKVAVMGLTLVLGPLIGSVLRLGGGFAYLLGLPVAASFTNIAAAIALIALAAAKAANDLSNMGKQMDSITKTRTRPEFLATPSGVQGFPTIGDLIKKAEEGPEAKANIEATIKAQQDKVGRLMGQTHQALGEATKGFGAFLALADQVSTSVVNLFGANRTSALQEGENFLKDLANQQETLQRAVREIRGIEKFKGKDDPNKPDFDIEAEKNRLRKMLEGLKFPDFKMEDLKTKKEKEKPEFMGAIEFGKKIQLGILGKEDKQERIAKAAEKQVQLQKDILDALPKIFMAPVGP